MEKLFFVQLGMGADLHGQDITTAAVRAVRNAIHHNSMPGLRSVLPGQDINNMKVNVRLAVPCDKEKLDQEKVKQVLPYGDVTVEVVDGGMLTTSGVVLPDKQDKNDLIYVVNAAVEVGY
ncbi:MAG: Lin0512 family protein [Bacillaceae bacterium]|nr:Lin0512 family protein [Bacillaceae bacterium]